MIPCPLVNWRLVDSGLAEPAFTAAADEAIALAVSEGKVSNTLHFYRRKVPTISLGYFQEVEKSLDMDFCRQNDIQILRRVSGGSAIYTDPGHLIYGLAVDEASLRRLVEFQIDKGTYGFTILGVLGEAAKLSVEERQMVVETVLATVAGRVPVVVGTSHPDTDICIELSNTAVAAGAAGVMIAPPAIENPTDDKVRTLYDKIAANYSAPIVLQDFPKITQVFINWMNKQSGINQLL